MKLTDVRPVVESSGQMEEQFFSIKDQGMIFDILRNKMYSNPILAICREISCNARDAHREVGKPDVPIQIVLPNHLDNNYRIKDWGPGISPDRMSNIFIQYTASTKRDDNVQTGGFGLGAKTPFSYSDTFAINTIYNGTKYQYTCFIDPTKVGKLAQLSQEPTKEPNSTEIVIPAEPKDAHLFAEWTEHACRHWSTKPIIKGGSIQWQTHTPILEGQGWAIASQVSHQYNHEAKMIVDDIEYPLSLDALRTYASTTLIDHCQGIVLMYFSVGELSLSASREALYLDKKTQDKIRERLEEMQKEIKKLLDIKIDSFSDLWQANLYYRKELKNVFNDLSFLGKLEWKGIELHGNWLTVGCPAFTFTRGKYSRKHGTDPNKLSRSRMTSVHFEEHSALFVNDLPIKEPTPRHVKKAFDDDPKLNSIQVICPTEKITEDKLNKTLHLDKLSARRLSEITKATGRAYTPTSARLLVFKFDSAHAHFGQVSYASIDEDSNDKVLCLLNKVNYPLNVRKPALKNNVTLDLGSMKSVALKSINTSFYGVDSDLPKDRIKEDFGDFISLEKYIDQNILSNSNLNYVEMKFAMDNRYHVEERLLQSISVLKPLISDPNSPFLKRILLHQKIKDISAGDTGVLQVYETFKGQITDKETDQFLKKHPELDIESINKLYDTTYPLLGSINHYNFTYTQISAHIAQYVNLIDKHNKNQKKV
jgi:hypothetical protein